MKVFARFELSRGHLHQGDSALLLEGHWPRGLLLDGLLLHDQAPADRWCLDREIDGRCGWIDGLAAQLAEHFAAAEFENQAARGPGIAWLNVVKLRYLLVKLLRVVAFFDSQSRAGLPRACHLFLDSGRDACYEPLMRALGRKHSFDVVVYYCGAGTSAADACLPAGRGPLWRRAAQRCVRPWQPAVDVGKPRVVLCGNPRLLAPVCRELVRRGTQPWWLAERFAPRSWLRWRRFGVGSLACDGTNESARSSEPPQFEPTPGWPANELVAPAVEAWLRELHRRLGPTQATQSAQIGRHLDRIGPQHVVLDQDGTPFSRAVVFAARQRGMQTSIVQHGAPFIRFGFAPLVADRFCAWGETSRAQLVGWGVPRERISVTGTAMSLPAMRVGRATRGARGPRFVLLATLAPADSRPDAVNYHVTGETFAAMIRGALAATLNWPGAQLTIKLHPRDPRSATIRSMAAEFNRQPIKIVAGGSLARVLRGADCVLSCASSAGMEAAAGGWPVIQLMPAGSRELLSAKAWGLVGTARSPAELEALIGEVISGHGDWAGVPREPIIAARGRTAAARIVDAILTPTLPREAEAPVGNVHSDMSCV